MSSGTGQTDLENRVLALERKAHTPEIPNIEVRLAVLEQRQQEPPGGSAGPASNAALFRVTTQIDGAVGSAYGTGVGVLQLDDGTNLDDDGTDPVEIKTHNEKGIVVDSYVLCVYALGSWWVAAPDQCGHLV